MTTISNAIYRIGLNALARMIRLMMNANGTEGYFCIGADGAFFEYRGMRFAYHYSRLGAAGNLDSGGSAEDRTLNLVNSMLRPGDVFYDIGAHEGLFSISVKKNNPATAVYAFEPFADGLYENLKLNGISDVTIYETAVGEECGAVSMTEKHRSSNFVRSGTTGPIRMITIDSLISSSKIKPPTLMKLDIEGFEFHALRGSQQTIQKSRPMIVTEINHCFMRYNTEFSEFLNFMGSLDYALFAVKDRGFIPVDRISRIEELPPSDDSNYWWAPVESPIVKV